MMPARPSRRRARALVPSVLAVGVLAGCAATDPGPLDGRGARGLSTGERLWVESSPAVAPGTRAGAEAEAPDASATKDGGGTEGAAREASEGSNARGDATTGGERDGDAPVASIGLLETLALAQENDDLFLLDRGESDIERQGLPAARAALMPRLNARAEIGRDGSFGKLDTTGPDAVSIDRPNYTESRLSLSLEQPLFDRASWLALSRARLQDALVDTRLGASHEAFVLRTVQGYFDVLRASSNLRFRRDDLEAVRRSLERYESAYEAGDTSLLNVSEARSRLDFAEVSEAQAADALADARDALGAITGLDPDAIELDGLGGELELERPDPDDPAGWVERAEASSLELETARQNVESARAALGVQRASRLPTVAIGARLSRSDSDDGPGLYGDRGSVSLIASVPLLSGGLTTARIAEAGAELRYAELQLVETRKRVARNARSAYRGVVRAIAEVESYERSLETTRARFDAVEAAAAEGERGPLDVIDAAQDVYRARADYATARYDYVIQTLLLRRAAGTMSVEDLERIDAWLRPG